MKRKFKSHINFQSSVRNSDIRVNTEAKTIQTSDYKERRERRTDNVICHDEETDMYFKHALETLKSGIYDSERELFVHNALEQTSGKELQLCCQSATSYCLELLLDEANDLSVVIRFMEAFSENLVPACGNRFASHITEALIYHGLISMQTWSSDVEAAEKNTENTELVEKSEKIVFIISWIHNLGEFCLKNLHTCLEDTYGCHVLRTVIQALGGIFIDEGINQSKKAKVQKKHFEEEYLGESKPKAKDAIALDAIPKFFVTMLKKLLKAFLKLDIKAFAIEPGTAPVIQVLLFVLKKRLPKHCKKFINILSSTLFESLSDEGIPDALVHKNCSYVVEKIFDSATEDQLSDLWKTYIEPFLEVLLKHPVGNYVVQRIFDVVKGKVEFEAICRSMFPFFNVVLESHHFGIWVSMATTCNRLKVQQAQFMKYLMQSLCCQEPEDRQLYLVPLLLNFEKYDDYISRKKSSSTLDIRVTLQGSLLVQAVLKFQKPLKVVGSLLHMKAEDLAFLASHMQGCHILSAFLASVSVGEKNKDKFLQILKPVLTTLACDPSGNLTLARMWMLLTLKQKTVVATELSKNNELLQKSRYGFGISKKFGLFYFKSKNDQWKQFQQNLAKKRPHSDT